MALHANRFAADMIRHRPCLGHDWIAGSQAGFRRGGQAPATRSGSIQTAKTSPKNYRHLTRKSKNSKIKPIHLQKKIDEHSIERAKKLGNRQSRALATRARLHGSDNPPPSCQSIVSDRVTRQSRPAGRGAPISYVLDMKEQDL